MTTKKYRYFKIVGVILFFMVAIQTMITSSQIKVLQNNDVLKNNEDIDQPISSDQSFPYPTNIEMIEGTKESSNYEYLAENDTENNDIELYPYDLPRNLDWENWSTQSGYVPFSVVDRSSTQHERTCDLSRGCYIYKNYEPVLTTWYSFRFYTTDINQPFYIDTIDSNGKNVIFMRIVNGLLYIVCNWDDVNIMYLNSNTLYHFKFYMDSITDKTDFYLNNVFVGRYSFFSPYPTNIANARFSTAFIAEGKHYYVDSIQWSNVEADHSRTCVPPSRKDFTMDSEVTFYSEQLTQDSFTSLVMKYSNTAHVSLSLKLYNFETSIFDEITSISFKTEETYFLQNISDVYINEHQLKFRFFGENDSSFQVTMESLYLTIDTIEFNGIETFFHNSSGLDPWGAYNTGYANILASHYYHSKVYELYNASRGLTITNDMTSDWIIEFYLMIENLGAGSGCVLFNLYGSPNIMMQYGYNQSGGYWAKNYTDISESNNIQEEENWTSNSWMHWRITWNATEESFQFYVNDTLLDTHNYPTFTSLVGIAFDGNSSGASGKIWIDSFSWSWHPDYYDRMIFDWYGSYDADSDGMPNIWEWNNGLCPHSDSDAFMDTDTDDLINLYEYQKSTNPNDNDSDDDLLLDGTELNTYHTNPLDTDSDDDLLSDYAEVITHLTNPNDLDSDDDLLNDYVEINTYNTDPNDADSDNDALTDGAEVNNYLTNPLDDDSDDDFLLDGAEVNTYLSDPNDVDSDDDLLTDYEEAVTYNTDPNDADSDNDLLTDYVEIWTYATDPNDSDSDDDGLNDFTELGQSTNPNDPDSDDDGLYDGPELNTYYSNPLDPDSDDDLLLDGAEVNTYHSSPTDMDTDDDLIGDYAEVTTYFTKPNDADSDDDLLNDYVEINTYTTNPNDPDSDDDTLTDGAEINTHLTNPLDADSDDDLLTDGAEVNTHHTNPLDTDSDDDLLSDYAEIITHLTNPNDVDSDDDLLNDYIEINTYTTDPNDADTDNDTLLDGSEVSIHLTNPKDSDSDDDLLTDGAEVNTYHTNPLDTDSDDDLLGDYVEINTTYTNPINSDSDGDMLSDYDEIMVYSTDPNDMDMDNDQLTDGVEITFFDTDPKDADSDNDLLNDYQELMVYLTDPNDADSDDDSLNDRVEILTYHTNPNNPDSDNDQIADSTEIYSYNTNPNKMDTDDDSINDYDEIFIYYTNPKDSDTDNDSYTDIFELNALTDPNDASSHPAEQTENGVVPVLLISICGIFGLAIVLYIHLNRQIMNSTGSKRNPTNL